MHQAGHFAGKTAPPIMSGTAIRPVYGTFVLHSVGPGEAALDYWVDAGKEANSVYADACWRPSAPSGMRRTGIAGSCSSLDSCELTCIFPSCSANQLSGVRSKRRIRARTPQR
jgi:hypothetical protein